MSSDFWAGYLSGAIGIIIGNPLDLVKVRLQAGCAEANASSPHVHLNRFDNVRSLVRGAAAPILGYGALNALLFVAYNRSLVFLDNSVTDPTNPQTTTLWIPLDMDFISGVTNIANAVSHPTTMALEKLL
ncbi:hypothetical protein EYZ11_001674 [Aspergillus tanneri]|uniref:Mitochondrial thiamine pyrophosphate carrier 1 n=1 Tax=Aspergillus tanneri TaxID=1220188 RepID=A0A4S3JTV1_9EURO|nr:hypothetical protein EYZ11_001674 [Aspergillus tanneri]